MSFYSYTGPVLRGKVVGHRIRGRMVEVLIGKDPFSTNIDHRQLEIINEGEDRTVATKQTRSPKELRHAAKQLGIAGWQEMGREELAAAVRTAEGAAADTATRRTRKSTSKKAPAKKAPASKKTARTSAAKKTTKTTTKRRTRVADGDSPNPFRPGTNLWFITEELMRGGKRSRLVQKLLPKLQYSPRVKSEDEFDPELETDRRLKVVGYLLKNTYGFTYTHEGRGKDAVIKATPPGA